MKPQLSTIVMHFEGMRLISAWHESLFFKKHVGLRDGPNKPQLRAIARIWREGSTVWYHQIYSAGLDPFSIPD